MWDFSWLERRWSGAGYEDWDLVLDDLRLRGYDAVRIDAFPHLLAEDGTREWTIRPCWNQQVWGSPAKNRVQVLPALLEFVGKCKEREIRVELSTWFQRDTGETWKLIRSAEDLAGIWLRTLDALAEAEVLDAVFAVDLCNEWPLGIWAPFFNPDESLKYWSQPSLDWMERSISLLRERYPEIAYTFSHIGLLRGNQSQLSALPHDFLDPHVWMVQANDDEFYKTIDYNYERFDEKGYVNVVDRAEALYRGKPDYWQRLLCEHIDAVAAESRDAGLPLMTTECWGIVDYKDWPLLGWEWVKECCEVGVKRAAGSGRWFAMATSNFCGPQFAGMWRDIDWHREMTGIIKAAELPPELRGL